MKSVEKSTFRIFAPLAVRIGVALIFILPSLISLVALATGTTSGPQPAVPLLSAALICFVLAIASLRASAFIVVSETHVSLGFTPIWVTRLSRRDVQDIRIVEIDAYKDYDGWGIKGSAKNKIGRLYSAGGSQALRLQGTRGRTYLVAFPWNSEHLRSLLGLLEASTSEQQSAQGTDSPRSR